MTTHAEIVKALEAALTKVVDAYFQTYAREGVCETATEMKNIAEAALASPAEAAGVAGLWQDIETAPKDGSDVLLYFPLDGLSDRHPKRVIGHWREISPTRGYWVFQFRAVLGYSEEYQPTYWQPLPAAPGGER